MAAGKGNSSKVAEALAESFWFLQEVWGPYRCIAGGLPQSADLGTANFPGAGGQQWSAENWWCIWKTASGYSSLHQIRTSRYHSF